MGLSLCHPDTYSIYPAARVCQPSTGKPLEAKPAQRVIAIACPWPPFMECQVSAVHALIETNTGKAVFGKIAVQPADKYRLIQKLEMTFGVATFY